MTELQARSTCDHVIRVADSLPVSRLAAPETETVPRHIVVEICTPSIRSTLSELAIDLAADRQAAVQFPNRHIGEIERPKLTRRFALPEGDLAAGDVTFRATHKVGRRGFRFTLAHGASTCGPNGFSVKRAGLYARAPRSPIPILTAVTDDRHRTTGGGRAA